MRPAYFHKRRRDTGFDRKPDGGRLRRSSQEPRWRGKRSLPRSGARRESETFSRREAQLKWVPGECQESTIRAASPGVRLEFCLNLLRLASVSRFTLKTMPTYEYACQKCGQTFDAFQSMRDDAYKTCPKELCRQARAEFDAIREFLDAHLAKLSSLVART